MDQAAFSGFSPCLFTFLAGLKEHNDKEWFDAHRADYEAYYLQPGRVFADELATRLTGTLGDRNGRGEVEGSLFRIYRDVRFSKDKRPYKTHLAMSLRPAGTRREETAGYYLHLEPGKLYLGAGLHSFSRPMLERFRDAVVDPTLGPELAEVVEAAEARGAVVWGQTYKRAPKGYDGAHPNGRFLLYGGLFAGQDLALPAEVDTPAFVGFAEERLRALSPVARWLDAAVVEQTKEASP